MKKVDKSLSIRTIMADESGSALQKYRYLTLGEGSLFRFFAWEAVTFILGPMPGALGIFLRRLFYKPFFGGLHPKAIVGRSCTIRYPGRIFLDANVVVDDYCVIDARGSVEQGVRIGEHSIINRNCIIQSKGGDIVVGTRVNIGAYSHLVSWSGIFIGDNSAIAGGCAMSGGSYKLEDFDLAIPQRQAYSAGPIQVGKNVWLATRVTLLDGVSIGDSAVVSAGSVVTKNVKPKCVVHGNPAKLVFEGR